jgi:PAS domain S-box-containing protein
MDERSASSQALAALGAVAGTSALVEDVFQNAPMPVFIKDGKGTYLYVNKAYCTAVGIAVDGIVGRTAFDLYPRDLAEGYAQIDALAIQSAGPITTDEPSEVQGRQEIWRVVRFSIFDEDREVRCTCGIAVNITASFQGVEESRAERQRAVERASFNRLIVTLTPQEACVLELLTQGLSDGEIAKALYLETNTVRHHVSHVLKKIRKRSRTQAVIETLKHRKQSA